MIGIVVGVLMILDQLDDLLVTQLWGTDAWRHLVGRELGDFLVRSLPSPAWTVTTNLVKLALGILLVYGAVSLRRRRRLGVTLCRSWAWLAIVWLVVETVQGLVWLSRYAGEIPGVPAGDWQGTATCGLVFGVALLLVWPVFLLVWLARSDVREETAGWPP
jgi:hypothetical protein